MKKKTIFRTGGGIDSDGIQNNASEETAA